MHRAALRASLGIAVCGIMLALPGCPADTTSGTPCNRDDECPTGQYCAPGGCTPIADGGVHLDGAAADAGCSVSADCDDHQFCNGTETCVAHTCVPGTAPCPATLCDETADHCPTTTTDFDHDGEPSTTDCDDADGTRYHGNLAETNRCDAIDNDCDPSTLGPDDDHDHHARANCCNPQADGTTLCGDDCDDTRDIVHPGAIEACDHFDNDCNGTVDEGVITTYTIDSDGDGYGSSAPDAMTMQGCTPPLGYAFSADDCDDRRGGGETIHPGALEMCDLAMADEDCDTAHNEDCGCPVVGQTQACCTNRGIQTCLGRAEGGGAWSTCSITATNDVCDGEDNDCDGNTDEASPVLCPNVGEVCNAPSCSCPTPLSACGGRCQMASGRCDGPDTDMCLEGDLSCVSGAVVCSDTSGNSVEVCNGLDDDCDTRFDEGSLCPAGSGQECHGFSLCGCPAGQVTCGTTSTGAGVCATPQSGGCDGADTDLCVEGSWGCNSATHVYVCSDMTPSTVEACDGLDNDCDTRFDEGSLCPVGTGQECHGASLCGCPPGQVPCGTTASGDGVCTAPRSGSCDGSDADVCSDGSWGCNTGSHVYECNDAEEGQSSQRQCNADPDCDGNYYENLAVSPPGGLGSDCMPVGTTMNGSVCTGSFSFTGFNAGRRTCDNVCHWGPYVSTGATTAINSPPAMSPFVVSPGLFSCPASVVNSGRDIQVGYTPAWSGDPGDCLLSSISSVAMPAGRYDITMDHYDSSVAITPHARVIFDNVGLGPSANFVDISNSTGNWETHGGSITVPPGCWTATIRVVSHSTFNTGDGRFYRGGDTVGTIRISGPY